MFLMIQLHLIFIYFTKNYSLHNLMLLQIFMYPNYAASKVTKVLVINFNCYYHHCFIRIHIVYSTIIQGFLFLSAHFTTLHLTFVILYLFFINLVSANDIIINYIIKLCFNLIIFNRLYLYILCSFDIKSLIHDLIYFYLQITNFIMITNYFANFVLINPIIIKKTN